MISCFINSSMYELYNKLIKENIVFLFFNKNKKKNKQ